MTTDTSTAPTNHASSPPTQPGETLAIVPINKLSDLDKRILAMRRDLSRLENVQKQLVSLVQLSQPHWWQELGRKLLNLAPTRERVLMAQRDREYLGYSKLAEDKWDDKLRLQLEELEKLSKETNLIPALMLASKIEEELKQRDLIYKDYLYRALKWSLWCKNTLANMLSSVRIPVHQKLLKLHLEAVSEEASKIDFEYLTKPDTHLLDPKVLAVIPTAIVIEEHRREAEKVFRDDIARQVQFGLIFYALFALTIIAPFMLLLLSGIPADFLGNRFFGIPLVVMVWSLVGCLAALIRRFNRDPVYDWATFWRLLLGRPAQALVLSAVFWVVLTAKLFSINGANLDDPFSPFVAILCFLLGFSDTFSNSIFGRIESQFSHMTEKPSDSPTTDQPTAKPSEKPAQPVG